MFPLRNNSEKSLILGNHANLQFIDEYSFINYQVYSAIASLLLVHL
jgi:hypothetical protein